VNHHRKPGDPNKTVWEGGENAFVIAAHPDFVNAPAGLCVPEGARLDVLAIVPGSDCPRCPKQVVQVWVVQHLPTSARFCAYECRDCGSLWAQA